MVNKEFKDLGEEMLTRQYTIAIFSAALFGLLFIHMLLDPILHWS